MTGAFEVVKRDDRVRYSYFARNDDEYLDIAVWVAMALDGDEVLRWTAYKAAKILFRLPVKNL